MLKINEAVRLASLVDIESHGPEWLEWCAALYESSYADHEYITSRTLASDPLGWYSDTAMRATEEIEYATYDRLERAEHVRLFGYAPVEW